MHPKIRIKYSIIVAIPFLLLIVLLVSGCDCNQSADGVILDNQSKAPIDSVSVATVDIFKNTVPGHIEYSGSNGHFRFSAISGGIKCPDLHLYFFKQGYNNTSLIFESYSIQDTIYLE